MIHVSEFDTWYTDSYMPPDEGPTTSAEAGLGQRAGTKPQETKKQVLSQIPV